MKFSGDTRRDFEKAAAENAQLKDRIPGYQEQVHGLRRSLSAMQKAKERRKAAYEEQLAEKDAVIKELKNRLEHETALKCHDGMNTGTPTSQTPINKKKVIPNSRRSTGKKKGGQPGHERHMMGIPSDDEVNETVAHELQGNECYPRCGGQDYIFTGECEVKYEVDIRVDVVKKRHEYYIYECTGCGERFRTGIAPGLRAECQYGPVLSLMNTVNAPINKVHMFLSGLTGGQAAPCGGYAAKLQRRASSALDPFMTGLRILLVTRSLVYWDDTAIMTNKGRGCLRFYGDEGMLFMPHTSIRTWEALTMTTYRLCSPRRPSPCTTTTKSTTTKNIVSRS